MGKIGDIRGTELEKLADRRIGEMRKGHFTTLEELKEKLSKKKEVPPPEPKK